MLSSYKIKLLGYVESENIWEKIQEKQNKGKKTSKKLKNKLLLYPIIHITYFFFHFYIKVE